MATEITKDVYVLTEQEVNERDAMMYLKGCVVGYAIRQGEKYSSKKKPNDLFQDGLDEAKPKEIVSKHGWKRTRYTNSVWVTVRHIVHNRMRHDRSHTGSFESDQEFLKKNWHEVKILLRELEPFKVTIPNLESE
jgi:hypothetical protein